MMESMPTTSSELLAITGIGESKLEKYGDEFLGIVRRHADLS
jgi:ATP-dependent DNA helicase RecQ